MTRGSATSAVVEPACTVAVTSAAWDGATGAAVVGTATGALLRCPVEGPAVQIGPGLDAPIVAVAIDPPTGAVAAADRQGAVRLLPVDGPPVHLALGARPRGVAWAPDRSLLALVSQAAGLLVVAPDGARRMGLAPSRRWRGVAWQPGAAGSRLVAFGAGGCTWIDPDAPEPIVRIEHHESVATAVAVQPGDGTLAVGDLAGAVRLEPGDETEAEISGWPDPVELLTWTARSEVVVVGGDEATSWSALDDPPDPARAALSGWISALSAHPWTGQVALGSGHGEVAIWDPATGACDHLARVPDAVAALCWDELGERVFVGSQDGGRWVALGERGAGS